MIDAGADQFQPGRVEVPATVTLPNALRTRGAGASVYWVRLAGRPFRLAQPTTEGAANAVMDEMKPDFLAALDAFFAGLGVDPSVKEVQASYLSFEIPRPEGFDPVAFATFVGEYMRDHGHPIADPVQAAWSYNHSLRFPASHQGHEAYAVRIAGEWTYFIVRK
ncbi:MAG: hypothetical protein NTZ05_09655 [Chloroflexi bacterium]|nr:hypothetical protein [Chloroflexota bacterium]